MIYIGDSNNNFGNDFVELYTGILENDDAYSITDVYGKKVFIMKNTKEGIIIKELIEKEVDCIYIIKNIQEWVLRIISVDDMNTYIDYLCKEYIEWGKIEKKREIKKVLGLDG